MRYSDPQDICHENFTNGCDKFYWWITFADPSLYLPALVGLVYSSDVRQSIAIDSIIEVLKHHNQRIEVIFLFLDCLR